MAESEGLYIAGAILLLVVVYVAATYNTMVRLRQHCRESFSGIETELKRRYELIPNLVEAVRGYMKYEREVLEAVVVARNRAAASTGSPLSQAADEQKLVGALRELFAVVENYPVLKAKESFLLLQEELANTEDRIQAARRFYNANVRSLNTRIEVLPSNLIASAFKFRPEEYFEVEDAGIRHAPKVSVGGR